ncbi:MAG: flagellar hook-length control protein FliK [Bdellovibrionales bacterium]|nr:flagellar hook-length control protein FliK [Bdellovibrionales bacterium]
MAPINSVGSSSAGQERWNVGQAEDSGNDEFSGAVAAADSIAAQSVQNPKAVTGFGTEAGALNPKSEPEGGKTQALATGKVDRLIPRNAGGSPEASSLIQKMTVSSNTGVDIAGLKPWSQDWVFEGGMNKHPLQKTLIETPTRGESAGALSGLEQLLQQLNATTVENSDEKIAYSGQLGQDVSPDSVSTKPQAGMNSLASADFLDVRRAMQGQPGLQSQYSNEAVTARQAMAAAKQAKGAIGSEQALALPGVGLKAPNAIGSQPDLREKKSKLPDTLGLFGQQPNKSEMGSNVIPFQAGPNALKLEGAVVPGAMTQNRLSSESVAGITQSIRQLGNGGEMRIRLKPDHLGELHLKVSTGGKAGSEVGLQIHASDSQAKRILEESMSSLREGLASQSLSLAKVDVQIAQPSSASSSGNDTSQDRSGVAGQQNFSSNSGGSGGRGNSAQDGLASSDSGIGTQAQTRAVNRSTSGWSGGGGGTNRAIASNRLDVIA